MIIDNNKKLSKMTIQMKLQQQEDQEGVPNLLME